MTVWPIFLDKVMYQEPPVEPIAVGDAIDWGVYLVDGEAEGWPEHVLVDAMISEGSDTGTIVVTAEADSSLLVLDRQEGAPARLGKVRAGLTADWFLPPEHSVTGIVKQVETVSRLFQTTTAGPGQRKELEAVGSWQLADVAQSPRRLGPDLGWRRVIVFGSGEVDAEGRFEPGRNELGEVDIVDNSMNFVGPEPGEAPQPEVVGLLLRVEVDQRT